MNASRAGVSVCTVIGLLAGTASAVVIPTVPVGNPGNVGELSGNDGRLGPTRTCGAVAYTYRIGKFEVTTAQYVEFLNAVAKADTYGLYDTKMWGSGYGCKIQQSGSSGSYVYSVAADRANRPVDCISWGDAARFANWLHNGQPTGAQGLSTTEDGAYFLDGATSEGALMAVTRKGNATWAIPTEDEWYKAAYHKNDGATGNYFDYPTSSDSVPSNVLGDPTDPGNNATYEINDYTIGAPYYETEVGAHENSESPYGTFDQGGNVTEWNEAVVYSSYRGLRGGSSGDGWGVDYLKAVNRNDYVGPSFGGVGIGFRLVYIPEPATILMLALAGVGIVRRRRA